MRVLLLSHSMCLEGRVHLGFKGYHLKGGTTMAFSDRYGAGYKPLAHSFPAPLRRYVIRQFTPSSEGARYEAELAYLIWRVFQKRTLFFGYTLDDLAIQVSHRFGQAAAEKMRDTRWKSDAIDYSVFDMSDPDPRDLEGEYEQKAQEEAMRALLGMPEPLFLDAIEFALADLSEGDIFQSEYQGWYSNRPDPKNSFDFDEWNFDFDDDNDDPLIGIVQRPLSAAQEVRAQVIAQVNALMKEQGIQYRFTDEGQAEWAADPLVQETIILPSLDSLQHRALETARGEFYHALKCMRLGDDASLRTAVLESGKSVESALKSLLTLKGITLSANGKNVEDLPALALWDVVLQERISPTEMKEVVTGPSRIRNKYAAHGTPSPINEAVANASVQSAAVSLTYIASLLDSA